LTRTADTAQRLRVLHVLNTVRNVGNGIINVAVDIACTQADAGHSVAIASEGGEYEALLARHGVEHYGLPVRRKSNALRLALRFDGVIRAFAPDIIHAHMMTGVVMARVLQRRRYRLVSHIHNIHQRSSVLMSLAERIIPVSDAVAKDMGSRGVPAWKMRVVPNAVIGSPRGTSDRQAPPAIVHRPSIVTVCGLYERKGVAELIAAFEGIASPHPHAHLYIVGDGPDRERFVALAAASRVRDRIHFEGFRSNPWPYLKSADVFVLASKRESCPLVILEACEAQCAIVASDVDGIPEQLERGRCGVLVPPSDVGALAAALRQLLDNPEERARLAAAAAATSANRTVSAMTDRVIAVYRELV
jgi:glycosyltransferase involved in cell wall biosynthesis